MQEWGTHAGDGVTYEVQLGGSGPAQDSALASIGTAVHFLDIGGIPVPDAKGLETVLKGIRENARRDDAMVRKQSGFSICC